MPIQVHLESVEQSQELQARAGLPRDVPDAQHKPAAPPLLQGLEQCWQISSVLGSQVYKAAPAQHTDRVSWLCDAACLLASGSTNAS